MLEKTDAWGKIVVAVQDRPLAEVAHEFDVTPGAITSALIRTGTRRAPVQAPGSPQPNVAPPPKRATGKTRVVRRKAKGKSKTPKTVNGLAVRPGTKDAAIAQLADLLGVEPDSVIADRTGTSPRTVAAFRRKNGIVLKPGRKPKNQKLARSKGLPPEKSANKQFRQRGKASKLDPYFDEIGVVPDKEIAVKAGVTPNAVAAYRRRRGIPPASSRVSAEAPPSPASVETAAPPKRRVGANRRGPATGDKVYRVERADGSSAFVVAADLVGAAQAAQRGKGVVGIHLAGDLL